MASFRRSADIALPHDPFPEHPGFRPRPEMWPGVWRALGAGSPLSPNTWAWCPCVAWRDLVARRAGLSLPQLGRASCPAASSRGMRHDGTAAHPRRRRRAAPGVAIMKMLSARSLANRWDCHRDTIYKMIDRGELPCRRISGMVRIPLDVIESIEGGTPWQDTGLSNAAREEPGGSAGLRIVGSEPEAFAQALKRMQKNGLPGSSPSSTSRRDPRSQQ